MLKSLILTSSQHLMRARRLGAIPILLKPGVWLPHYRKHPQNKMWSSDVASCTGKPVCRERKEHSCFWLSSVIGTRFLFNVYLAWILSKLSVRFSHRMACVSSRVALTICFQENNKALSLFSGLKPKMKAYGCLICNHWESTAFSSLLVLLKPGFWMEEQVNHFLI